MRTPRAAAKSTRSHPCWRNANGSSKIWAGMRTSVSKQQQSCYRRQPSLESSECCEKGMLLPSRTHRVNVAGDSSFHRQTSFPECRLMIGVPDGGHFGGCQPQETQRTSPSHDDEHSFITHHALAHVSKTASSYLIVHLIRQL